MTRALRHQADTRGLRLVASSDWHGWTGTWRTWTLVRPAGPIGNANEAVIHSLRNPAAGEVVPVVAGRLGPPSLARAALAPLVEGVRYAAELGPLRVLGWWLWLAAGLGLAAWLRGRGLTPGPMLGRAALVGLGAILVANAAPMALAPAEGAVNPDFHREVGGYGLALGGLALLLAMGPLLARWWPGRPRLLAARALPGAGNVQPGTIGRRMAADLARWGRTATSWRALAEAFPTRPPTLGRAGWLATVAVAVLAGASMLFLDRPLALWLERNYQPSGLVRDLSDLGKSHWYLLGALAVYLLWPGNVGRARASLVFWGVAASGILVNIVKAVLGRYRPELLIEQGRYGFDFFRVQAEYLSFPSGHTTTVFSLAMCLALFWPRGRWLFFGAAAAVAVTRVLLTSHYPSDVLAGAWLGVVTVLWLRDNKRQAIHP